MANDTTVTAPPEVRKGFAEYGANFFALYSYRGAKLGDSIFCITETPFNMKYSTTWADTAKAGILKKLLSVEGKAADIAQMVTGKDLSVVPAGEATYVKYTGVDRLKYSTKIKVLNDPYTKTKNNFAPLSDAIAIRKFLVNNGLPTVDESVVRQTIENFFSLPTDTAANLVDAMITIKDVQSVDWDTTTSLNVLGKMGSAAEKAQEIIEKERDALQKAYHKAMSDYIIQKRSKGVYLETNYMTGTKTVEEIKTYTRWLPGPFAWIAEKVVEKVRRAVPVDMTFDNDEANREWLNKAIKIDIERDGNKIADYKHRGYKTTLEFDTWFDTAIIESNHLASDILESNLNYAEDISAAIEMWKKWTSHRYCKRTDNWNKACTAFGVQEGKNDEYHDENIKDYLGEVDKILTRIETDTTKLYNDVDGEIAKVIKDKAKESASVQKLNDLGDLIMGGSKAFGELDNRKQSLHRITPCILFFTFGGIIFAEHVLISDWSQNEDVWGFNSEFTIGMEKAEVDSWSHYKGTIMTYPKKE